ncbi:PepSY domain-containing protein [Nocardioides marmoraquaticus]
MNRSTLTRKRVLVPAVAVLALGVGGTAWATTAAADQVGGTERDRVAQAATELAGGGDVTSVETSDDRGEAYEVEVRQADGTEVDLALDSDLGLVERDTDRPDGAEEERDDRDADDRVLSADERDRAERAALGAVEGGRVLDVEASDDRGVAYDVEVLGADGTTEWDVDLADDFTVVDSRQDR